CARRHDVVPVVVTDPVEEQLPLQLGGLWPLADAESGQVVWADLSDRATREAYAPAAAQAADRPGKLVRQLALGAGRARPGARPPPLRACRAAIARRRSSAFRSPTTPRSIPRSRPSRCASTDPKARAS